jgi:pteridine reductase
MSIPEIEDESPVALVTGASQRLGARIARALHARGMRMVVHYHQSAAAANTLAAELESTRAGSAMTVQADLASADAPAALITAIAARWGRLDVLVNNAAVFRPTPCGDATEADWDEIAGTNLRAPWLLTNAAMPLLSARGGNVINIVDIYAERPRPGFALYCAAKAGLVGLTRALARELAPAVRVNAVAPGAILWSTETTAADKSAILAKTPLGRLGSPDDIAEAVCYLLDASYVTGQVLNIDGGRTIFD